MLRLGVAARFASKRSFETILGRGATCANYHRCALSKVAQPPWSCTALTDWPSPIIAAKLPRCGRTSKLVSMYFQYLEAAAVTSHPRLWFSVVSVRCATEGGGTQGRNTLQDILGPSEWRLTVKTSKGDFDVLGLIPREDNSWSEEE